MKVPVATTGQQDSGVQRNLDVNAMIRAYQVINFINVNNNIQDNLKFIRNLLL